MIKQSILLIAVGSILWAVIDPAIVLIGISTPRKSGDDKWWFFQAYGWLSYPASTTETTEISSTCWLGFHVSIVGLSIFAAGVIGIILAAVRGMRAQQSVSQFFQGPSENSTKKKRKG